MTNQRLTIPLAMTILVSPEVQVLLGNGMGLVGWFFPICLVLVAVLHTLTVRAYSAIYRGRYRGDNELAFLTGHFGHWLPLTTSLASRLLFMVCAATVGLVTAGFVFNEVFVYWFANFGFAFLLLALIVLIQLAGRAWALRAQTFLVCFVMTMLALLAVAGFSKFSPTPAGQAISFQGRGLLFPFLMVVGVEFAFLGGRGDKEALPTFSSLSKGFGAALLLMVLWGVVLLLFVEPARLAGSYSPHMIGARLVLGQPGRLLMGAALIAGAAALVNGLLLVLHGQLGQLLPVAVLAATTGRQKWLAALGIVVLAAAPGLMMAMGMAGEEGIDLYIRVALAIWLGHYSLVHFAVYGQASARHWPHLLAGILLLGAGLALGWTESQPFVFLKSVGMIMLAAGAVSLIIMKVGKRLTLGG